MTLEVIRYLEADVLSAGVEEPAASPPTPPESSDRRPTVVTDTHNATTENNTHPISANDKGTGHTPNMTHECKETKKPMRSSASVSLHGEKTNVVGGEDILLKLSAANLITKPPMHVQAITIPPSGMSVSSSEFVESGAGQYMTTYDLEPGRSERYRGKDQS